MVLLRSVARGVTAIVLLSPTLASAHNSSSSLPIVDLGYELYRASGFNETRHYYNFSNIRYAAPPVGNLRFKAPAPPVTNRSVINDGSVERICPHASGAYGAILAAWFPQYLETGIVPSNISWENIPSSSSGSSTPDSRETEDCLFLDVIVPQKIFESAGNGTGAPVLVWIYGGGYVSGSKTAEDTPSGLIQRSITNSSDGVIYVAMNYRLGALGWLAGPTFQKDGTANAGLHDQRFALQWVQGNIHLFGGDKNRVTVFGESAGGASIMHQLTAYGGTSKAPFKQAISQSPAWLPQVSLNGQEQIFQDFLKTANVSSLEEARELSSEQVIAANTQQIAGAYYGTNIFGPTVDGDFVTQDPKSLLNHGQFDKSVKIMAAHNAQEGVATTPPVTTNAEVETYLHAVLPNTPSAVLDYVLTTLYPPVYNGTGALYTSPFERLTLIITESAFICNTFAMATARNESYEYLFGVYPGLHGQDVPNTYYDPGAGLTSGDGGFAASLPFNETVALVLQDYITSFALTGVPSSALDGLSSFPEYGADGKIVELALETISVQTDPAANERCKWWGLNLVS